MNIERSDILSPLNEVGASRFYETNDTSQISKFIKENSLYTLK